MKLQRLSIPAAAMLAAAILLQIWCQSCRRNASAPYWNTGVPAHDRALARADTLDRLMDYNADAAYDAYRRIASMADTASASAPIRATAHYALGVMAEFADDDSGTAVAAHRDSLALATLPSGDDSYIRRRLQFELARKSTDVAARTSELYRLLPYFTQLRDSMMVNDVLFELTNSFGEVWDPATQKDCFEEIIRWTPHFQRELRDLMRYNVLAIDRGTAPADRYLHILDSVARCGEMLRTSPPLGVVVYADRYRLRGHASDLDSAAAYADKLVGYHDALKTYWTQRLRHAMKSKDAAEAERYAALIGSHAADSSIMEVETLPALLEYYLSRGDSAAYLRTDQLYRLLRAGADAHEESSLLAGMEADRKVSEITRRSHSAAAKWILISGISLALLAVAAVGLWLAKRRRRRDRRRLSELHSQLDHKQRRLVVAEMKRSGAVSADGVALRDWERFETVFTEMHPGFADGLRRDFPALTRNDIRLCAFISMDMDVKHISSMLGIQPDSVKKQMRRLRAKLGLEPAAPLLDFLRRYTS